MPMTWQLSKPCTALPVGSGWPCMTLAPVRPAWKALIHARPRLLLLSLAPTAAKPVYPFHWMITKTHVEQPHTT